MFSRRLATFLLGVWMGCCMLVDVLAMEGQRAATRVLDLPISEAKAALTKAGDAPVAALLHHLSSEQVRAMLAEWEFAQLLIAALLLALLTLTEQRKIPAIAMAAAMFVCVLFQHFMVLPDLAVLGRSLDFVPENANFQIRSQVWTLTQAYAGLETLKLVTGGVLASYFFALESTVKRSKLRRTRSTDFQESQTARSAEPQRRANV